MIKEALEASIGLRICRQELWKVSHMNGFQVMFPFIASKQPVGTVKARKDALARWQGFENFVQTEIHNLQKGLQLGFSAPKNVVGLVVEQLDSSRPKSLNC
jgi:uncharacterized protein (DUF885 family)